MDAFAIVWLVFSVILLSAALFGEWAGKAGYILSELLLLILGIVYIRIRKLNLQDVMRWYPVPSSFWLPGILTAVGSAILLEELDRLVSLVIKLTPEQVEHISDSYSATGTFDFLWIIIGVGIAAPFVEESLFRGVVQRAFENRWDITRAVMLTGFLFAAIHLRIYWFIQLLIMAVWVGYFAWKWNSVIPAVLIHAANNLWSVGLLTWVDHPLYELYEWRGHVNPIVVALAVFVIWRGVSMMNKVWLEYREAMEGSQ